MNLSDTETDSLRTDLWLLRGDSRVGTEWEGGVSRCEPSHPERSKKILPTAQFVTEGLVTNYSSTYVNMTRLQKWRTGESLTKEGGWVGMSGDRRGPEGPLQCWGPPAVSASVSPMRYLRRCCYCLVTKSCVTLCDPVICSPPGSSVHGILQATILEWAAISFFRGSP